MDNKLKNDHFIKTNKNEKTNADDASSQGKKNKLITPELKKSENNFKIITDYFNFDENDIDLHKMKKCFDSYLPEFSLTQEDLKSSQERFKEFISYFEKSDLNKFSFPCLKNCVMGFLTSLMPNNNGNEYSSYYFFLLVLSNKSLIRTSVYNFYLNIIRNNYFGISPKFGYVITREVTQSEEYKRFTEFLAQWYTRVELVIFYITILNQFFGVMLNFDEKKYSLESNFDFSIQTFAKKNLLKLVSFICKKSSLDLKLDELNYDKMFLILISSFTCGLSITDIFTGGDLSKLCYMGGGLLINLFIGKVADSIENYSNFLEFSRLETIMLKLNRKIDKIHKKVFELLKLVMLTKLDYKYLCEKRKNILNNVSIQSEVYPGVDEKIDELFTIVNKYFQGVECVDNEAEKKMIEESLIDFEILFLNNSVINEDWAVVNICKK